jgi:23S rRNA G2445 N2-methylase RlmL
MEVWNHASTLEELMAEIGRQCYQIDRFKVMFLTKNRSGVPSLTVLARISDLFAGYPDLRSPDVLFGVAALDEGWFFGPVLSQSENRWRQYGNKPHGYSSALPNRLARALINLTVEEGETLVDPCCGVGTVLIEAADMGIDAAGFDINPKVVRAARENLVHFGFLPNVHALDAAHIKAKFDGAIVDLPYGKFIYHQLWEYDGLLARLRHIANRATVLYSCDITAHLGEFGLRVMDRVVMPKGRFQRHIHICTTS